MGTKAPGSGRRFEATTLLPHAKEGAAVCQKRDTRSNCRAATSSLVYIFKIADVVYCLVLMPANKHIRKFFVEGSNTVALD